MGPTHEQVLGAANIATGHARPGWEIGRFSDVLGAATFAAAVFFVAILNVETTFYFVTAFAIFAVAGVIGAVLFRSEWLKNAALAVTAVAGCLAATELVLLQGRADRELGAVTVEKSGQFKRFDDDLGYTLIPGSQTHVSAHSQGKALYDVTYNVGDDGFRRTDPQPRGAAARTILFVGDSYPFGQALNDGETLPSQLARLEGDDALVLNAGVPGYGPHNVLRALELGRYDRAFRQPQEVVILWTAPQHIKRAAGLAPWENGPRYEVGPDEKPVYQGPLKGKIESKVLSFLYKSKVFSLFYNGYVLLYQRIFDPTGSVALQRYGAIMSQIEAIVKERYNARLLLIVDEAYADPSFFEEVKRRNLDYVRLLDIVPDRVKRPDIYTVPSDGHPSLLLTSQLAASLHDFMKTDDRLR